MANVVTNYAKNEALKAYLSGQTLEVLLLNPDHLNDADHDFVSEINANELSDTTYNRQTISNVTFTEDDTSDKAYIDADDVVFSELNTSRDIAAVVVYVLRTDDTDSEIIGETDTIENSEDTNVLPIATNGSDIQFNINNLLELV